MVEPWNGGKYKAYWMMWRNGHYREGPAVKWSRWMSQDSNSNYPLAAFSGYKGYHQIDWYCAGYVAGFVSSLPYLVWYESPDFHIPAMFTFTLQGDRATWKFVGSPDENCDQNSNWIELCGDSEDNEVESCNVPDYAKAKFKCLGIRILSTTGGSSSAHWRYACLKEMKFWEV